MEKINLDAFRPKSHHLKPVFQRHRVRQIVLGKFLGVSQSQVSHWLNGYCDVPKHMERRLQELAGQLEGAI